MSVRTAASFLLRGTCAGGAATFAEEAIPFTDAIPSVTITWFVKYVIRERESFEAFVRRAT
jgi:hypothetical protein